MKEFRFKLIIIVAAVALSIYLLYPTYLDYRNSSDIKQTLELKREQLKQSDPDVTKAQTDRLIRTIEDSILAANPDIVKNREKRVKLGLDLQGGMRVVLEVNTGKLLEKLAKNPDETFSAVLAEAQQESEKTDESVVDILARKFTERGIRLSRYFGTIRDEDSQILSSLTDNAEDAVTRAVEIIRNRVDQYGVSEPSIQRQGSRRIIIELPGIAREEEARRLIQATALLEFKIVREPEFAFPIYERINEVLKNRLAQDTSQILDQTLSQQSSQNDTTLQDNKDSVDISKLTEEEREKYLQKEAPFYSIFLLLDPSGKSGADGFVNENERLRFRSIIDDPQIQKVIPNNVEFVISAEKITQEGNTYRRVYLVNSTPELTGGVLTDATANIDPNTSAPIVEMTMNSEGATEWARITGANINKRIAIVLDGNVYSAPVVQNKIPGGKSQITGIGDLKEAQQLEIILKAGALPAPVDIIEERSVGPSLGEDSINKGLLSVILGYALVGIFMVIYYRRVGTIAAAALTFTILFILGVLAGFNATLTLPGIAGIILTIGMAVDANVLIFERIREEMATGKTIKASVDSGFSRAYSAIIDSNITTFFTGIILYQFGTGPIQGFALTLMIGIAASLFSALVITRLILDMMVSKNIPVTVG